MKEFLFWSILAATSVLGYYIMARVDILEDKLRREHRPFRWRRIRIPAPTLTPLPSVVAVLKQLRHAFPLPRREEPRQEPEAESFPLDPEDPRPWAYPPPRKN